MSVRRDDRTEGRLGALDSARLLKEYTFKKLRKSDLIPKSQRWLYAYPLSQEIHNVLISIRHANATYVQTKEEYRYRRLEQTKAHAALEALNELVEDVYNAGYINSHTADVWIGMIRDTDKLVIAWRKSDYARFKDVE